jgi:parvulin-like peptidyl-prolyl isomerase
MRPRRAALPPRAARAWVAVRAVVAGAALLGWASAAWAGRTVVLDDVKIAVNDKAMTRREVASLRQFQEQQLRQAHTGSELEQRLRSLDQEIVKQIVEDLLLEAYATQLRVEVSDKDIEERVDAIVARQPDIQEQYSDEQLKTFVLKELLRRRVLAREVDGRVRVSQDDVIAACRRQTLDDRELDVGHILVRGEDPAARRRVAELRAQLLAGADFEELATKHSEDPSAASNRGRLGFIGRGQFVKPFEDAAFALSVGAISEPVPTQFGLHLIKVFAQREKGRLDCAHMDDVTRQSLENQLFAKQREARLQSFMERLRRQADVRVFD